MSKELTYESYGHKWSDVVMHTGSYISHPMCMYLALDSKEDGPLATITVNLGIGDGRETILPPFTSFIDTNNNPEATQWLEKTGLAKPFLNGAGAPVMVPSGYCEYPLYQFNRAKLEEYDLEGVSNYMMEYSNAMGVLPAEIDWGENELETKEENIKSDNEEVHINGGDGKNLFYFYINSHDYPSNLKENIARFAKENFESCKDSSLEEIQDKHIFWGTDAALGFKGVYNGDTFVLFDDINKLPISIKEDALSHCEYYRKLEQDKNKAFEKLKDFDEGKHENVPEDDGLEK